MVTCISIGRACLSCMLVGSLLVNPLGVVPETLSIACIGRGLKNFELCLFSLLNVSELPFALIWQKTCEMGSAYNALKAEKVQLAAKLEAALHDLVGVKGTLAEREKSLEESREANKALVAEMEKMGKQRTELMGQMKVMNRRCISQEEYVGDWARKMIALLGGKFCFFECFSTVHFMLL